MSEAYICGEGLAKFGSHFDMQKQGPNPTHNHFTEQEGSVDTVVGFLLIDKGCVKQEVWVFSLIDEGIGHKDVAQMWLIGKGGRHWILARNALAWC